MTLCSLPLHSTPHAHPTSSPPLPPPPPPYHGGRCPTACDMDPPSVFATVHSHNSFGSVGRSSSLDASHAAAVAAAAGPLPPTAIWRMAPINLQLTPPTAPTTSHNGTYAATGPLSSLQVGGAAMAKTSDGADNNARRTSYYDVAGCQPGAASAGFNTSHSVAEHPRLSPAHNSRASPQQHYAGSGSLRLSKGLLAATSAAAAAAAAAGIGLVSHSSLPLFLSGTSSSAGSGWPASSVVDSRGRDQDQVKARKEGSFSSSSSSSRAGGASPPCADVSSPQAATPHEAITELLGSLGTALLDGSISATPRFKLDGGMGACTDEVTGGPSRLADSLAALNDPAIKLFNSRPPSFRAGMLNSSGGSISATTAQMLLLRARGGGGSSNNSSSSDPRLTSDGGSTSSINSAVTRFSCDSSLSFADAGQAVHRMLQVPPADASTVPGLWPTAPPQHGPFAGLSGVRKTSNGCSHGSHGSSVWPQRLQADWAQAGHLNGGSTLLARYLAAMAAAAAGTGTGTASNTAGGAADPAAAAPAGTLLHGVFWDVSLQPCGCAPCPGFSEQHAAGFHVSQQHLPGLELTCPPPAAPGLYPVASWGAGYGSGWAATAHHHPAMQHQLFGGLPGGHLRSSHSVDPYSLGASCPPAAMLAAPGGRCPPMGSTQSLLTSRADPRSLRGVDPRLCVGEPGDVEREVCRRNPGLAEILRLRPHSVPLANPAVREDAVPLEELTASKHSGRVDVSELTVESGLLRYCFGLPSSVGPDLVRAARQAVTRNGVPGSGLEPFFWTLHAKMAWLLKRPVFFKGQLLRGEIHAITDQQRVESFARVTEQRSRLGELVVALYAILRLPAADAATQGQDEAGGARPSEVLPEA